MAQYKKSKATVKEILDAAQKLFLEKGYDNTTIQDLTDELGGLTKGAVYHHFKSKEEIMDALSERMFSSCNPFETVRKRTDLNGLEKMQMAVLLNQSNESQVELTRQALPLLKNPHVLARMIDSNRRILCPYYQELIEEGQKDGSISTPYAKEMAEFLVLMDFWLIPSVFPGNPKEIQRKCQFIFEVLEKMGLPLGSREILEHINDLPYFSETEL